jgi:hypothetical protein
MGTRGMTIVVSEGKNKVAQYGQWDHYPSGQGVTALEFLRTMDLKKFKSQLSKVRFLNSAKRSEIKKYLNQIGSVDGWMTTEQSEIFKKKYPYLSRDHGANILNLIYNSTDKYIWLTDSSECAVTSNCDCEYTYVIDLDKKLFQMKIGDAVIVQYPFKTLPTVKKFIKEAESKVEKYYK